MAASPQLSVTDQIRQLEGARKLVLKDVSYYPQVIQATLPIIGPSSQVEFRRWGSEFLAEAFATPAVPLSSKETLSLVVLDTLKALVEDPKQDVLVLRGVIQAAASIYPLAMRWIINNSYDSTTWEKMTAIKTRIRDIWDTAPLTVRVCCVKFVQRVVLAHTSSVNPEPRRGDPLDISRNMVPPNHPALDGDQLEAEASGLLDRMLSALETESSDPLLIDATLNTLSILVRQRPKTSSRIVSTLFNFNPLRLAATAPLTPKTKVLIKSMEKTTRMLLTHLYRRDPHNPLSGRMQQYVERLVRSRAEIFDESGRKRAMVDQASAVEAKRQRTATLSTQPQIEITPLKPGPNTLAEVFTFTTNDGLKKFNVSDTIPAPLAAKISVRTIAQLDADILQRAIDGVRARITACREAHQQPINPETAPLDVEEDDDDYEPDYYAAEDTEQLMNKLDSSPSDERRDLQAPVLGTLSLPAFKLPPPPTLGPEQAARVGQGAVARVFGTMQTLEDPGTKKSKAGLNRLAANSYDRDSWITVVTRLATRANAGLDNISIKEEGNTLTLPTVSMSDTIREMLYTYILEDFRKRIDVAVTWLSEEWYKERVQQRFASSPNQLCDAPENYEKWTLRLVDAFLPYLHSQDKVLTRFLSELPELTVSILARVQSLCRDPSLVNLALTSLYYLVMFRPPVRNIALDTVQDIWTEYEDARPTAAKYLQRWRPGFVDAAQQGAASTPVGTNGTVVAT
ncbi:putative mRNA cleavage and polyadenylation specificity factor complex subunit [Rosellinia necatrix]|uniref:Putative mRNA cleavage and polyadenylation specificity factor complex subunit n=1 Tax=Rosellinia necatrix TaxID=77044 RepID=A0A1W2TAV5_ROSNE|nr:putative mRNA cleavage and polyadenylation specificity factor complex subunit [Rosellinia necatrix]